MTKKRNVVKTTADLTPKQRKFVDVLVANWGQMSKADASARWPLEIRPVHRQRRVAG